jgi:lipopolysaccharide export system protein LptA
MKSADMINRRLAALLGALSLAAAMPVHAEKADREKPVNLEADRVTVDDAKKVHVFDGNVTLTQGTLVIRGDRIVVTQDDAGFQKGVATGNPAKFKQKREGRDDYVEGIALRIEHNAKTEKTELYDKAWVKSGQDEVKGAYISYEAPTEKYLVTNTNGGTKSATGEPQARVRAIIQPKNKAAPAEDKTDAPALKPAPAVTPR